uniref:hypothetical protein n=1 Tax=Ornithobacterium rhinotracheale TaxID=28251 RepID=UPI0039A6381C
MGRFFVFLGNWNLMDFIFYPLKSFNKMTNEVKNYRKQVEKYEGMKSYFQSFLDNSKEGKRAFEKWKSLKTLKQGE